jgi:hypothetical protein
MFDAPATPGDDPDDAPEDDFEADGDEAAELEEDLLVVFPLAGGDHGSPDEQQQIDELGDELAELLDEQGLGEYDGDEYGGGECTMFFCGDDSQALMAALRPILRRHPLCRRGYFVRLVEGADGHPERRREPI